jgi:alkyl hydroperoxide reductase subunit D
VFLNLFAMSEQILVENETFTNLLNELGLQGYTPSANARVLIDAEARYIKDLKINTGNVLHNNLHLTRREALLLAYAAAVNEHFKPLKHSLARLAEEAGASQAEIAEVTAAVSLMNTNNVFYRFRHFMQKDVYSNQPAGIKMSIMINPVTGKEFFELVSLVISALNGCEMCVTSHEQSVLNHGGSQQKIFEAVKLGAVIKGLITILA